MPAVKFMKNDTSEKERFKIKTLVASVLFCYLCAIGLMLIVSWVFLKFEISQTFIPVVAKSVLLLCAFSGGVFGGANRKNNGYLFGAFVGFIYVMLLLGCSLLFKTYHSDIFMTLFTIFLCVISGALGGIIGINCKVKKKRRRNLQKS